MVEIVEGDVRGALPTLRTGSVQCVVTSPPYWGLRDYGCEGQIGLEATPEAYVATMVGVFREVRRVLREDGTLWLNLGDSYANTQPRVAFGDQGSRGPGADKNDRSITRDWSCWPELKPKDLAGMPWRVAFALQADGWFLRSDIIWAKPNPMPESVTDRPTKAHEYVFLLTKGARYFYDADAVREPHQDKAPFSRFGQVGKDGGYQGGFAAARAEAADGRTRPTFACRPGAREYNPAGRNMRSVWTIPSAPFPEAHFATFPPALADRCILAGSRMGDTVLDPFGGSGTVGACAEALGRNAVLIELSPAYAAMARRRTAQRGLFAGREG